MMLNEADYPFRWMTKISFFEKRNDGVLKLLRHVFIFIRLKRKIGLAGRAQYFCVFTQTDERHRDIGPAITGQLEIGINQSLLRSAHDAPPS